MECCAGAAYERALNFSRLIRSISPPANVSLMRIVRGLNFRLFPYYARVPFATFIHLMASNNTNLRGRVRSR